MTKKVKKVKKMVKRKGRIHGFLHHTLAVISAFTLLTSLFFLTASLTGNVIFGNSTNSTAVLASNSTDMNFSAFGFFIIGIVFALCWFKGRKN